MTPIHARATTRSHRHRLRRPEGLASPSRYRGRSQDQPRRRARISLDLESKLHQRPALANALTERIHPHETSKTSPVPEKSMAHLSLLIKPFKNQFMIYDSITASRPGFFLFLERCGRSHILKFNQNDIKASAN